MCEFARRLDDVRTHCETMLRTRGLTRDKVMSALLRIVDLTAIRVGHEEYTRDNDSFGLTTLRTRHARVRGATVELRFRGKSGIQRTITFRDPTLAKVIADCHALGGPRLFQYRDAHGTVRAIDATQLNGYLHSLIGKQFSVKDFRTWSATVCVAVELSATEQAKSQRAAKKQLLAAIRTASTHLGNTPAICRKSYVHPLIMDAYLVGKTLPNGRLTTDLPGGVGYQAHEQAVRRFLLRLIRESERKPTPPTRVALKQAS
jgi:DNA topoisomerase-1